MMLPDLYVAPPARRRDLGRALVARPAAEAGRQGACRLWWGVNVGDEAAMLFYRAIGARCGGRFSGETLAGPAFERLTAEGARA